MRSPTLVLLAATVPVLSLHAAEAKKKVLIVEVTTGYRHASIATGEKVIGKLAADSGVFEVAGIVRQPTVQVPTSPTPPRALAADADDSAKAKYAADLKSYQDKLAAADPAKVKQAQEQFSTELQANLAVLAPEKLAAAGIDGVIFDSTTGSLPLPDRQGFLDWIKAGHAFIGIHSATDTFHDFKPYLDMIGGEFDGHPWHQAVTVRVEDSTSPAAGGYRQPFEVTDEIYQFKNFDRGDLHVVLSLDPSNANRPMAGNPPRTFFERGKRPDKDYAVSWVRDFGKGRVFYTSLGHEDAVWNDPKVQEHMLGGIEWALGVVPGVAPARQP